MNLLLFACCVFSESTELEALLMAESIRTFGGLYANAPIWWMIPADDVHYQPKDLARIDSFRITIHRFPLDVTVRKLPFAAKTVAAGHAEAAAANQCETLVWLDCDVLLLQSPDPLQLPSKKVLGCRPVDLANISALANEPLPLYWSIIYQACGSEVVPHQVSLISSIDRQSILPHWNAGCIAARPERKLLQTWSRNFLAIHPMEQLQEFYRHDRRYAIFAHQAILAGTILAMTTAEERIALPNDVNFPLHLWERIDQTMRIPKLDEFVMVRYDNLATTSDWIDSYPMSDTLRIWCKTHFPVVKP
ncbi:MAG: hypothetical protein OEM52_10815 [bacterium]|nr:hypothetical protein [bacterium]